MRTNSGMDGDEAGKSPKGGYVGHIYCTDMGVSHAYYNLLIG